MIKFPLSTEKSIRLLEAENKLVFEVEPKATRKQVKEAVEKQFNVKVEKVNILTNGSSRRAYVKLNPESSAMDVATDLGLM